MVERRAQESKRERSNLELIVSKGLYFNIPPPAPTAISMYPKVALVRFSGLGR